MAIIKPDDVEFIFANEDKTYTVGVGYDETNEKGEIVHKVRNQIVSANEGAQLAKLLKKRDQELHKVRKAAAAQPMPVERRAPPGPMIINGRPVTSEDLKKVRRRRIL